MRAEPDPDRWRRLEEVFFGALELDPDAQAAFLDRSCGGDPELRLEVEKLLGASGKSLDGLRRPVEDAAREVVRDGAAPVQRIGAYRLVRLLGEGGMGLVYLAERADDQYRRQVAIKLMHAGLGRNAEMLRRFRSERQILANLDHPNIARLLDGGITPEGSPYLVMEYVNGVAIDAYCRQARLTIDGRLRLFRAVCEAVEYAHRHLVVHRDIKPGNILVTPEGVPKLVDFGIAKLLDPEASDLTLVLTQTSGRLMTPEYASPEQVRGEPVTTLTDVYALGVLLYELLTGQAPFRMKSASPLEVARLICEQEPARPSAASRHNPAAASLDARSLRGDLDNIVLKAMSKEPARRYASLAQFSDDVRRYLDGYPVEAGGGAWRYRAGKFVKRHKAGVAATAAACVAIVGFGIAMGVLAHRAALERETAEREAQFLSSIYQASTPAEARGRPVNTLELLDRGVKRIDTELADNPEAQATMLDNLGEAYLNMGVYDRAEAVLRQAYDLRRRVLGDNNADTASALGDLATAIRLEARFDQAEPLFRRALAVRTKLLGLRNSDTTFAMASLGECLYLENKYGEAEELLRKALELEGGAINVSAATTRNYLALTVQARGDYEQAAQLLREAVDIDRRTEGADSPDFANSLHNLAGAELRAGDVLGAEAVEREDLDLRRRILGNDHPDLAYSLNNLGWILLQTGDLAGAESLLGEQLALVRRHFAPNSPRMVAPLDNWARVLQAKGDYAQAEDFYRQALALVQPKPAASNWGAAQILANIGILQLDRGDYAGAERYARQALEMRRKLGGDENPEVATSLIDVGVARVFQGDAAGAEAFMRQGLDVRRKTLQPGNPDIIDAEVRLGDVLVREGKASESEAVLRQAVDQAEHPPFALLPWQIAEARSTLGECLLALGKPSEAEPLLRESQAGVKMIPDAALRRAALKRMELRVPSGTRAIAAN
jgi:tetratricopeptide (TPR) repeat protein